MSKSVLLAVLATLACEPSFAAELGQPVVSHHWHTGYQRIVLPPERHVIEIVKPPYSGNFIINHAHFVAETPACLDWSAGERVVLRAGDWHGDCTEAVFYNVPRHSSCAMWCRW